MVFDGARWGGGDIHLMKVVFICTSFQVCQLSIVNRQSSLGYGRQ